MTTKTFVIGLQQLDKTKSSLVGGKGANLGELTKIEGVNVPQGFCISTEAYKRIVHQTPAVIQLIDELSLLKAHDGNSIRNIGTEIRNIIENIIIPGDIIEEITQFLSVLGETTAFAIRSSATAEDLPTT